MSTQAELHFDHGFWKCSECPTKTDAPHEGPFGETLCEACCDVCASGATRAWVEQQIKEGNFHVSHDDAIVGHGAPTREQMAEVGSWG